MQSTHERSDVDAAPALAGSTLDAQRRGAGPPRSSTLSFLRNYVVMVLVMIVGMLVLGSALGLVASAVGAGPADLQRDAPAVLLLGMGFSMTAPMVWWMRRQRHSPAANREMAGAMIAPTLAVVALLGAGAGAVDDVDALLGIQHVAMLPARLAVMLLRRAEYSPRVPPASRAASAPTIRSHVD